jgi:hypothetical protein
MRAICSGLLLQNSNSDEVPRSTSPPSSGTLRPSRSETSPDGMESAPATSMKAPLMNPTWTVSAPREVASNGTIGMRM